MSSGVVSATDYFTALTLGRARFERLLRSRVEPYLEAELAVRDAGSPSFANSPCVGSESRNSRNPATPSGLRHRVRRVVRGDLRPRPDRTPRAPCSCENTTGRSSRSISKARRHARSSPRLPKSHTSGSKQAVCCPLRSPREATRRASSMPPVLATDRCTARADSYSPAERRCERRSRLAAPPRPGVRSSAASGEEPGVVRCTSRPDARPASRDVTDLLWDLTPRLCPAGLKVRVRLIEELLRVLSRERADRSGVRAHCPGQRRSASASPSPRSDHRLPGARSGNNDSLR
jgi:hypothetical protein